MGLAASVIVPTRGRCEQLGTLLRMLNKQRLAANDAFEVIIAQDGEPYCEPASDTLSYPITYVTGDRRGISRCKNEAVARASGEVLIFVNDDLKPEADFIHEHLTAQRAGNSIVLGHSAWQRYDDQTVLDEALDRTRMIFFYCDMEPGKHYGFRHAWHINLSLHRSLIDSMDAPFRHEFQPLMYEDLELAYRLMAHDARVYYHAAASGVHAHRYSLREYLERESMLGFMARTLWTVNRECYRGIFECDWDQTRDTAVRELDTDNKDAKRALATISRFAATPVSDKLDTATYDWFYAAHLMLKRRAFRCGVLAAADENEVDWRDRLEVAAKALQQNSVFAALYEA